MTSKQPLHRIGIVGSYGGLNLGDEAILQSIEAQIRASIRAHLTVFSRAAEDTRRRHAVDAAVTTWHLARDEPVKLIEPLDLLIVGGGGILFDAEARQVLEEAGLRRDIVVTADPALLPEPEPIPLNALPPEAVEWQGPVVGMSVREPGSAAPSTCSTATPWWRACSGRSGPRRSRANTRRGS